jgi:CubicO group peptidase (beta-lactamase class C family)
MKEAHISGLSACTIDSGRIVWSKNYGYADIGKGIKVSDESLFMIASSSKTVTASAVMLLFQQKKIDLDTDINKYLPFKVHNPTHKNGIITVRHLLRHASSIVDNRDYLLQFWSTNNGDPTLNLEEFLKEYLAVDGKNYSAKNFLSEIPGTTYSYSNIGFSILGLIVETISRKPFNEFCNTNIFKPLKMDNTAWYLREVDIHQVAMPYDYIDSLNIFIPYGHGGYPDYPAGQLRTSAKQLASFLAAWTNNGSTHEKKIFENQTIQTLTPDEFMLGFHTWSLFGLDKGNVIYSHFGGDNGLNSFIGFHPYTKRGVIILMNSEIRDFKYWNTLINKLYYLD